jgi:hypothetical protein
VSRSDGAQVASLHCSILRSVLSGNPLVYTLTRVCHTCKLIVTLNFRDSQHSTPTPAHT